MCWIWTHKWWLYIRSTIWGKLTSKKHQNNLFFLFLFFFNSFFSLIVIVQLRSLKWTFLRNPHHQTHCARKGILAVLQHSEFNLKQQQQQLLRWCLISKQQNLIITDLSWYSGAPVITAAWITICIDVIKSKCLFVNTYDKGGCVLKDRFQKLSRSN